MLRWIALATEVVLLSVLILAARCANYQDVFVAGNVYFTDADCYARMTRARMCAEHPGLVVRHHEFENFPPGTKPHTTAPLDYLIVALSILLQPFTAHGLDLAGALISPLLALLGGWFLWWWSRRMKFRYRWVLLSLYAISPILVHAARLGRPDHQSLSILLVTIAICAEWTLRNEPSRNWAVISGIAWGLAIWVSAYEPLLLLLLMLLLALVRREDRQLTFGSHRRIGWIAFAAVIGLALLVERRIPSLSIFYGRDPIFQNWSRAIGELAHVAALSSIWFRWVGYMIVVAPVLIWLQWSLSKSMSMRKSKSAPVFVLVLLAATYLLTMWQARWAYFFALIFAITLPSLLEPIKSRAAVSIAFALSILPLLRDWDERLWPGEIEQTRRLQQRNESVQLRELALKLSSTETRPFLAPWWISPAMAYWSAQPGVAGSSHESLDGIADSARFFLADDWQVVHEILLKRKVDWVLAYDAQRVAANASQILGSTAQPVPAVCFALDLTPARAPTFLSFSAQNSAGKLYRVVSNR